MGVRALGLQFFWAFRDVGCWGCRVLGCGSLGLGFKGFRVLQCEAEREVG